MIRCLTALRPLALAAALVATGAAQASITVYTTAESFWAAIAGSMSGTDSFDNFESQSGPVTRSAGDLQYTVDAAPKDTLVRTGNSDDGWLSAGSWLNKLTFSNFTDGTFAAGGTFFGSADGQQAPKGIVIVKATAADESVSRQFTFSKRTDNFFVGFVSDAPLTSVTAKFVGAKGTLVTVNDLILAGPVPEPETYALLLSGLAVVGFVARRRRAD